MDAASIQTPSNEDTSHPDQQVGNYFRDGKTKIGILESFFIPFWIRLKFLSLGSDYVLVWETWSMEARQDGEETAGEERGGSSNSDRPEVKRPKEDQWRERFTRNLEAAGLLTEKVPEASGESRLSPSRSEVTQHSAPPVRRRRPTTA